MVLVLSFFGLDVSPKESTILCCDMLHGLSFFFFKECAQPFPHCDKGLTSLFPFILYPRMAVMFSAP